MAPLVTLGVTLVEATTLLSAPWLAAGGILVALRECLRHFWKKL